MTDAQFEKLIVILSEINENIKLITAKDTGKDIFGLSDIYSELTSIERGVSSVESAVDDVTRA